MIEINIVPGPDFYQEVSEKELWRDFQYLTEGYFHIETEIDSIPYRW